MPMLPVTGDGHRAYAGARHSWLASSVLAMILCASLASSQNVVRCDSGNGRGASSGTCVCPSGYSATSIAGVPQCHNIDECSLGIDNCNRTTAACVDTAGSFICRECSDGFAPAIDNTCQHVDQCPSQPCLSTQYRCVEGEVMPYCLCDTTAPTTCGVGPEGCPTFVGTATTASGTIGILDYLKQIGFPQAGGNTLLLFPDLNITCSQSLLTGWYVTTPVSSHLKLQAYRRANYSASQPDYHRIASSDILTNSSQYTQLFMLNETDGVQQLNSTVAEDRQLYVQSGDVIGLQVLSGPGCPASERVRVWLEMNGRGDSDHSAVYSRVNGTALRRNITICVTTLNAILSGNITGVVAPDVVFPPTTPTPTRPAPTTTTMTTTTPTTTPPTTAPITTTAATTNPTQASPTTSASAPSSAAMSISATTTESVQSTAPGGNQVGNGAATTTSQPMETPDETQFNHLAIALIAGFTGAGACLLVMSLVLVVIHYRRRKTASGKFNMQKTTDAGHGLEMQTTSSTLVNQRLASEASMGGEYAYSTPNYQPGAAAVAAAAAARNGSVPVPSAPSTTYELPIDQLETSMAAGGKRYSEPPRSSSTVNNDGEDFDSGNEYDETLSQPAQPGGGVGVSAGAIASTSYQAVNQSTKQDLSVYAHLSATGQK